MQPPMSAEDDTSASPLPHEDGEGSGSLWRQTSVDSQAGYTTAYSSFRSIASDWDREPSLHAAWVQLPLPPAAWSPVAMQGPGQIDEAADGVANTVGDEAGNHGAKEVVVPAAEPRGLQQGFHQGAPALRSDGTAEEADGAGEKDPLARGGVQEAVPLATRSGHDATGADTVIRGEGAAADAPAGVNPHDNPHPAVDLGWHRHPSSRHPTETNGDGAHGVQGLAHGQPGDKLLLASHGSRGTHGQASPVTASPLSLQLAQMLSEKRGGHDTGGGKGPIYENGNVTGASATGSPSSSDQVGGYGDEQGSSDQGELALGGDAAGGVVGGDAGQEDVGEPGKNGRREAGTGDHGGAGDEEKRGMGGEGHRGTDDDDSDDSGKDGTENMGIDGSQEDGSKEDDRQVPDSEISQYLDMPPTPKRRISDGGGEGGGGGLQRALSTASSRSSVIGASESDHAGELESWEVQRYAHVTFCLHRRNPLRKFCIKLLSPRYHGQYFDNFMVLVILLNCIFLALYRPTDLPNSKRNQALDGADIFFLVVFTAELCIKLLAFGVCNYWRDHWNKLDALVVITGYIAILDLGQGTNSIRVLRVLRPLRAISILPGLRVLVGTILHSIPMLGNVLLLCLLFGVLFGILGVSFFAGELRSRCVPLEAYPPPDNYTLRGYLQKLDIFEVLDVCTNSSTVTKYGGHRCPETELCLRVGNPNHGYTSFDNFLWALLTILQCVTLEQWTDVMYWTQDGLSGWAFLYFLALIFVGTFFLVNLLLAVIVYVHEESVEAERQRQDQLESSSKGSSLASLAVPRTKLKRKRDALSRFVRRWKRRAARNPKVRKFLAPPPPGSLLYRPHRICDIIVHGQDGHGGEVFHATIVVLILVNTVVLSLEYHGMSDTFRNVLEDFNIALAASFILEMIIKMFALGLGRYFDSAFHVFDVLVNVTSLVEIALSSQGSLSALRGLRVLRVLKLVSKWSSLQIFLKTLWATVRELGNFSFIIALLLFVYALMGMQLFGSKFDFDGDGMPDDRANFDTLLWSVVTVFQIITGENWNQLMYTGMRATNNLASLYFLSLILIGNYLVVNLFVAILLTSFEMRRRQLKLEKKQREAELAKLRPSRSGRSSFASFLLPKASRRGSAASVLANGPGTETNDSMFSRNTTSEIDTFLSTLPPLGSPSADHHRNRSAAVTTLGRGRVPASEPATEVHSDSSLHSPTVSGSRMSISSPSFHPMMSIRQRSMSSPVLSEYASSQGTISLSGRAQEGALGDGSSYRLAKAVALTAVAAGAGSKGPASRSNSFQAGRSEVSSISEDVAVNGGGEGGMSGGGRYVLHSMKSWSFNKVLDEMSSMVNPAEAGAASGTGPRVPEVTRRSGSFSTGAAAVEDLGALQEEGEPVAGASSDVESARTEPGGKRPHHRPTRSLSFNRRGAGDSQSVPLTPQQPPGRIKRQVSFHDMVTDPSIKGGPAATTSEGGSAGNPPKGALKPSLSRASVAGGGATGSEDEGSTTAATERERRERERAEEREMMRSMALENWSALAYKSHAREQQSDASSKGGKQTATAAMDDGPRPIPPLESFMQRSCFLFSSGSWLRQRVYRLVTHRWFEMGIMATIVASSIAMAIESPATKDNERLTHTLKILEYIFVITFSLEMVLKIIAFGFVGEKGTYIREWWNVLDGFIVVVSLVNLGLAAANVEWGRALRALRVLRPLRMISRIPELQIVVRALLASFPGLGNLLVVSALIWLIFAILGMSLFMGTFYYCTDPSVADRDACQGTFLVDGVEVPRRWRNANANFDNIVKAMMTLFELVNGEGWVDIMYAGVDAVGVDQQPRTDHDTRRVWFFIAFMLIGSFFILKLFIGIIMDNYSQMRERAKKGHLFMTERQRKWAEAQKRLIRTRPRRRFTAPSQRWRKPFYFLVNDTWLQKERTKRLKPQLPSDEPIPSFEYIVLAVILLNMVFMAMQHADEGRVWSRVIDDTNYAFVSFFLFELTLKLLAYGPIQYFADSWNRFDFVVVAVSVVELFFTFGTGVSVLRLLRLARFLRYLKSLRSLTTLFNTLLMSMPTLANVLGLMFLLLFIFAVLGVELFGKVTQHQENIDRRTNFQNWGYAMLTLFRMCTGEGWNGIMYDCMVQPDDCVGPNGGPCCSYEDGTCGRKAGFIYFIAFQVVGTYIVLNLFLAVVLENYNKETRGVIVTDEDLEQFRVTWEKYDPEATMFLPVTKLFDLMREVPPPLGISDKSQPASQMQLRMFLMSLNITLIGEGARYLFFQDVLTALTSYAHGLSMVSLPPAMLQSLHAQLGSLRQGASSRLDSGHTKSSRDLTRHARLLSRISEKSGWSHAEVSTTGERLAKALGSSGPNTRLHRNSAISEEATATDKDKGEEGNKGEGGGNGDGNGTLAQKGHFCASDYFAAQVIESHIHRYLYRRRLNEYASLLRMRRKLAETQVVASMLADVKSALRRRVLSSPMPATTGHSNVQGGQVHGQGGQVHGPGWHGRPGQPIYVRTGGHAQGQAGHSVGQRQVQGYAQRGRAPPSSTLAASHAGRQAWET
eukprot:jgi/Mesvir1/27954/Mv20161-RA.1